MNYSTHDKRVKTRLQINSTRTVKYYLISCLSLELKYDYKKVRDKETNRAVVDVY